jgi:hypothetical protein
MIVLGLLRSRAGRVLVLVGVLVMLLALNAEAFQAGYQARLAELRHGAPHHAKPPGRGDSPPLRPGSPGIAEVPSGYLPLYRASARTCPGLSWGVLAGIGKVETNHGRGWPPDFTRRAGIARGTENAAGAGGPMQFLAGTWAIYGRGGDRWSARDAIPAAARLLCANGLGDKAPHDPCPGLRGSAQVHEALFAYNHACWYVDQILAATSSYQAGGG